MKPSLRAGLASAGRRNLAIAALCLTALTGACGVPISAEDLTETPEAETVGVQISPASVRIAGPVSAADLTAIATVPPAATPSILGTASATSPRPAATQTPSTASSALASGSPTPAGGGSATPAPTSTPSPSAADLTAQAVKYLNDYRTKSGREALRVDPNLSAAASAYARLMADKSWFLCRCDVHTGPDGSQPESRIAAAGYRGRFRGEALAAGQASGDQAIITWLNSGPHAAIVLDTSAVDVGIGYAYNPSDPYHHYWALVTAIP